MLYDKDIIPAPESAAATENEVSEEPSKVVFSDGKTGSEPGFDIFVFQS